MRARRQQEVGKEKSEVVALRCNRKPRWARERVHRAHGAAGSPLKRLGGRLNHRLCFWRLLADFNSLLSLFLGWCLQLLLFPWHGPYASSLASLVERSKPWLEAKLDYRTDFRGAVWPCQLLPEDG